MPLPVFSAAYSAFRSAICLASIRAPAARVLAARLASALLLAGVAALLVGVAAFVHSAPKPVASAHRVTAPLTAASRTAALPGTVPPTAAGPPAGAASIATPVPSPDNVPMLPAPTLTGAGEFTVADGEGELFVLVRHAQSGSLQLRTPAGQVLTRGNVWRAGRWYADDAVDAISIDVPAAGTWQLLGLDAAATVVVLRSPQLRPLALPDFVLSNTPQVLRWQLHSHGQPVAMPAYADLVVARARLRTQDTDQDMPVERSVEGTVQVALPALPASSYAIDLDVWVKTLHLHARHHVTAWTFPTVQVERRGDDAILWVKFDSAGLDPESMGVVAAVLAPNRQKRLIPAARRLDGSFCVFVAGSDWRRVAGDLRVTLQLQGRSRGGTVWRAPQQVVVVPWLVPHAQARIYAVATAQTVSAVTRTDRSTITAADAVAAPGAALANAPPHAAVAAALASAAPAARAEALRHPGDRAARQSARVAARRVHEAVHKAARRPGASGARSAGPNVWYLSGLMLANLALIGLLILRARRAARLAASVAVAVEVARGASEVVSTSDATAPSLSPAEVIASAASGAKRVPADADADSAHFGDSISTEFAEPSLSPQTPEAEAVGVDAALMEELAALAATQSDLRAVAVAQAEAG